MDEKLTPENVSEINLANFEEYCRMEKIYNFIKESNNFKKVIKNFKTMYNKFAATKKNMKMNKGANVISKKDIQEIEYFMWDKICQKKLLNRIINKDKIVDNWDPYLKSSINWIIKENFWQELNELALPESGLHEHSAIKKIKYQKNKLEKLTKKKESQKGLSENDQEHIYAIEEKILQINELIFGIGTVKRNNEDYDISETLTKEPFDRNEKKHLLPQDVILQDLEMETIVTTCINKSLSSRESQCIRLYYYDGLTQKEIGNKINLTDSRVAQIIKKAKIKLKRCIEKTK